MDRADRIAQLVIKIRDTLGSLRPNAMESVCASLHVAALILTNEELHIVDRYLDDQIILEADRAVEGGPRRLAALLVGIANLLRDKQDEKEVGYG